MKLSLFVFQPSKPWANCFYSKCALSNCALSKIPVVILAPLLLSASPFFVGCSPLSSGSGNYTGSNGLTTKPSRDAQTGSVDQETDRTSLIIQKLESEDAFIRKEAAKALERLGPRAEKGILPLVSALTDPDPGVRHYAGRALVEIGVKAIPALVKVLQKKEGGSNFQVADIQVAELLPHFLQKGGERAKSTVLFALKHKDKIVRNTVSRSCVEVYHELIQNGEMIHTILDEKISPSLLALIQSPDETIKTRTKGGGVLITAGLELENLASWLNKILKKPAPPGKVSLDSRSATNLAVQLCTSETVENTKSILINKFCKRIVMDFLMAQARKENPGTKKTAIIAIGSIANSIQLKFAGTTGTTGTTGTIEGNLKPDEMKKISQTLFSALRDKNSKVRTAAICALVKIRKQNDKLKQEVKKMHDDPSPSVRLRVRALLHPDSTISMGYLCP